MRVYFFGRVHTRRRGATPHTTHSLKGDADGPLHSHPLLLFYALSCLDSPLRDTADLRDDQLRWAKNADLRVLRRRCLEGTTVLT